MSLYEVTLRWSFFGLLLITAVLLMIVALRPQRQPPNPAVWQDTLAKAKERHRHRASPRRLCVIQRTEPNLRLAEVNAARVVEDRPGRHDAEFINQPTCVLPDFPRLIREGKL